MMHKRYTLEPALMTGPIQEWVVMLKQELAIRLGLNSESRAALNLVTHPGDVLGIMREIGFRKIAEDEFMPLQQPTKQIVSAEVATKPKKRKPRKSRKLK